MKMFKRLLDKKYIKNSNGQALVEMAFVLPILLIIVMGIFEFGRIFNTYLVVTNASREGVRIAAVGGLDENIMTSVNNSTPTLNDANMSVTIQPYETVRRRGDEVSVTIDYSLEIISPIISTVIPNPFPISSTTYMRME